MSSDHQKGKRVDRSSIARGEGRRSLWVALAVSGLLMPLTALARPSTSPTSEPAKLAAGDEIREKIEGDVTISTPGNVIIRQKIEKGTVTIKAGGYVQIGQKIDQHANVVIMAGAHVMIGQKIDQHSRAVITAGGNVTIGEKIDQSSSAEINSLQGSISIGQKVDQHSRADLIAPNGSVNIGQGLSADSHIRYRTRNINIGTVDAGCSASPF
jgi:hypothetical protein